MDSGAVKQLSMKSRKCHPNQLEPEGKQPVINMADNKMLINMKNNYLKEQSIQEELEKVKIENFLEFYSDGRYEIYKCSGCFGPQLGHIAVKFTRIKYENDTVRKFEMHLKEIKGFKEELWKRDKEREKLRAKEMVEAAAAQAGTEGTAGTAGGVAQIVKPRPPPLWTGQKFDRWKVEVISWHNQSRGNDEENYLDLVESLKRNKTIKEFMNRTLIQRVSETRTVERILEIMSEKFDRNMGEKTLEMMRIISGEGFKADESVDKMMDRFGDMIVEMKKIRLAENSDYGMGLSFLERLEKSSKVNAVEKKMLRDILEDADGNPRAGETLELMKKELIY